MTLVNSTVSGNTAAAESNSRGGGIYSAADGDTTSTELTLTGSAVDGNSASGFATSGGGIASRASGGAASAALSLTDSAVSDNAATGGNAGGGGIHSTAGGDTASATVTLTDSAVSGNTIGSGSRVLGGGIHSAAAGTAASAAVTLTGSAVSGNTASGGSVNGGGIHSTASGGTSSAAVTLTDSTVGGNAVTATGIAFGGGINSDASFETAGVTLTLTNSTVSGNSASGGGFSGGGGIASRARFDPTSATLTLTGSTISGNRVGGGGGGIYSDVGNDSASATVTLTNSTLSDNRASDDLAQGGGIFSIDYNAPGNLTLTLDHATLADNTAAVDGGHHLGGNAPTAYARSVFAQSDGGLAGADFANSGAGAFTSGGDNVGQRDLPGAGATDLANTDPRLGPLADNGGPTLTHLPLPDSPAIDRGPVGPGCPAADQRGVARPQGAACDSGAVEAPCASPFADVAANDPACVAIAGLVRQGIIQGYATAPPTFGPDDDVQRAQLAAFLVRALGWQGRPTGPRSFSDFGGLVAELRTRALHPRPTPATGAGNCVARGYGGRALRPDRPGQPRPGHHVHRPRLRARPGDRLGTRAARAPARARRRTRPTSARTRQRRGHPRRADHPGGLGRPGLARLGRHGALAGVGHLPGAGRSPNPPDWCQA